MPVKCPPLPFVMSQRADVPRSSRGAEAHRDVYVFWQEAVNTWLSPWLDFSLMFDPETFFLNLIMQLNLFNSTRAQGEK